MSSAGAGIYGSTFGFGLGIYHSAMSIRTLGRISFSPNDFFERITSNINNQDGTFKRKSLGISIARSRRQSMGARYPAELINGDGLFGYFSSRTCCPESPTRLKQVPLTFRELDKFHSIKPTVYQLPHFPEYAPTSTMATGTFQ